MLAELFPLPIFPEGGLTSSVIVTVWVGIAVVALMNLRLGWVLSGLVVPGYMVPLLMTRPTAAAVVFAEGVITYFLVWLYSEFFTRYNGWSNFFGRDRFFALVLTSVAVRIVSDALVLPEVGQWIQSTYRIAFDYRSNLHSFGLIVIALIANNFWKSGLRLGIWPMVVQVGITYLIVRYVLVPTTNFNIASLGYMYEDIAASLLATPKAYIILLVTAFIASRLNLFYGWDFSGILIPSLLALQWYQPMKILTSMVEAVIILLLAMATLSLPIFRGITMEGARKLLLFFNISFVYKMVLGWALVWFAPDVRISDWYGFGYLLPTLIALKMHDKNIFARLTRATLQTSITGVAVATIVGFVLLLLPDPKWYGTAIASNETLGPVRSLTTDLQTFLQGEKTRYYASSVEGHAQIPLPREVDAFSYGVRRLLEYRRNPDDGLLLDARRSLAMANFDVIDSVDFLVVTERDKPRGWGTYVLRKARGSGLVVEVPAPLDEHESFEAALSLFTAAEASEFAASGGLRLSGNGGTTALLLPQSIFQAFHREIAGRDVLQVRAIKAAQVPAQDRSLLHVAGTLSPAIPLSAIESAIGSVYVDFSAHRQRNLQRETTTGNFSELWLEAKDATQLAALFLPGSMPVPTRLSRSVGGEILAAIPAAAIAAPGSGAYQPPSLASLFRLDREVVSPLFRLAQRHVPGRPLDADSASMLRAATRSAEALGYQVQWWLYGQRELFVLADRNRHRGWIFFEAGNAQPTILEVPRPHVDNGTLEYAVSLLDTLRPRVLIVAGAAPDANPDGAADVMSPDNDATVYNLAHQVVLREYRNAPAIAVAIRSFSVRPDQAAPQSDVVAAFDTAYGNLEALPPTPAGVVRSVRQSGKSVELAGGPLTAGYDAIGNPQINYLGQTKNKHFAVFWISPAARRDIAQESFAVQGRQFTALGISIVQADVVQLLTEIRLSAGSLPERLVQLAESYSATQDIVTLSAMKTEFPTFEISRIEDEAGRGAFLLFRRPDGKPQAVMSLSAVRPADRTHTVVPPGRPVGAAASRYVSTNSRWLRTQ